MKPLLRSRPWVWLLILFCLPLLAWAVFIYMASQVPMQRLDKKPVPEAHNAR